MTDSQAQQLIDISASTNEAIRSALEEVKQMRKGETQTNTAEVVAEAIKQVRGSSDSKKSGSNSASTVSGDTATSVEKIVNAAAKAANIDYKATTGLAEFITDVSQALLKLGDKDIDSTLSNLADSLEKHIPRIGEAMETLEGDGAINFQILTSSLLKFSASLALSLPLLAVGSLAIPLLALTLVPLGAILNKLAQYDNIDQALNVMPKMAIGLLAFSGSVALSSMIAKAVEPEGLLAIMGVLAVAGVTYALLGQVSSHINKGSIAVLGISGSMFIFGLAATSTSATLDMDLGKLMQIPLVLGAMGLSYALVGKLFPQIALGSLGVLAMSGSLYLLAMAVSPTAEAISTNPSMLYEIPLMVGGLTGSFALAGTGLPLIAAGALGVSLASGSLYLLAGALEKFSALDFTKDNAESMKRAISATFEGFANGLSTVGLSAALIPLAIPLVAGMGLSLNAFSKGLGEYKANAGDWTVQDSRTLEQTVSGLSQAFATAGSTDGMARVLGIPIGQNAVARGVESTKLIGDTLTGLSKGILAWDKVDLSPAKVQKIGDSLNRVLSVIPASFAQVGARENESTLDSFLGISFTNPLKKSDIEAGVESVERISGILGSLTDGVLAWSTGGEKGINDMVIQDVVTNVTKFLGALPTAFAEIGRQDKESEGFFPWSDGDIERGIELVTDLSPTLVSITELVNTFREGDTSQVTNRISTELPKMFAAIANLLGSMQEQMSTIDLGDVNDDIDEMIDISEKLNELYSNLADVGDPLAGTVDAFTAISESINSIDGDKLSALHDTIASPSLVNNPINTMGDRAFLSPPEVSSGGEVSVFQQSSQSQQASSGQGTQESGEGTSLQEQVQMQQDMINGLMRGMEILIQSSNAQVDELRELRATIQSGIKLKEGLA